ncbi:site-specific recombinase XerD [Mycobacteroides abscessus subsp. massiliense]|nr:site-specific recombinase XerD [Mycobacteroides abscessus subsp. massiliense]SKV35443.1 site-specific recombinase XerD [Mycobacteroides abscessus subsp. massiliense]
MMAKPVRSRVRGRPRVTDGCARCTRCGRSANKLRVYWPGDGLCNSCFYTAMRTYGICPRCGHDGVLPGRANRTDERPVCLGCAGIPGNYQCCTCGVEGEILRAGECARCVLRGDLAQLLLGGAGDQAFLAQLIDVLCGVDRPESIITWKRSEQVKQLFAGLRRGEITCSHESFDALEPGRHVSHLRSILVHHGLLPRRDERLMIFEGWIEMKLAAIGAKSVRGPVEQFARWHHLSRIRANSTPEGNSDASVRSAKQEITETIKFLTWLNKTRKRSAATCRQLDVDEYLASGPTTRHLIRTFFIWAKKSGINRTVDIGHRVAKTTSTLTQEQRLHWLKELLAGASESLPYRVAGTLLLLYGQLPTRIAALTMESIVLTPEELRISLGTEPAPVPEPFASLIREHLANRPNLRTAGGTAETPWLFPSNRAGSHIDPQTIMQRLRSLGINLHGARNSALQHLVKEAPPPIVAELLGYSYQVAHLHAQKAAQTWSQYAAVAASRKRKTPTR